MNDATLDGDAPLVSVLLCNRDYGRFVARAIESVLDQKYETLELVVVDDGSTDDSRDVIARYRDPRLRAIFQENGGQPAAFNAGFAASRGGIVCLLDSDDWWFPHKLETLVRWDRFLEGRYGVLQHGLDVFDEERDGEGGRMRPYRHVLPSGDCVAEMRETGRLDFFVPTSGLCFRRDVLDRIFPLPTHFRIVADAYLMRAAVAFGPLYSIPESLGAYRRHATSASRDCGAHLMPVFARDVLPALNDFYRRQGIALRLEPQRRHRWIPPWLQARLRPLRRRLAARRALHSR